MNKEKEEEIVLEPELQKALDKVGNNPMEEPEIFKIIEEVKGIQSSLDILDTFKDIDSEKFSAKQISHFIRKVSEKIQFIKDEDGNYKSTKNTENCDLPSFKQATVIYRLAEEKLDSKTTKKRKEEIEKEEDALIWKVAGLKKDNLTEWEQTLVSEQIKSCAYGESLSSLGIKLKN